jgi:ribA/ribD-fused uncharacterized protein
MPKIIDRFEGPFAFLSNFYMRVLEYRGLLFMSVENPFQGEKGNSLVILQRFSLYPPNGEQILTPGQAKREGRALTLRKDWPVVKDPTMLELLRIKFGQDRDMRKFLLNTGDATLIEGNNWCDNYWGDCYCPKCINIPGRNQLGKFEMQVRSELQ